MTIAAEARAAGFPESYIERIRTGPNGCWEWTGARLVNGYGSVQINRKRFLAHRVAWEIANQGPIPVGLHIDHLCRNRRCVNPAHLEPVTPGENTRRGMGAQITRERRAAIMFCKRGHPLSGTNVYTPPKGGWRECRECRGIAMRRYEETRRKRLHGKRSQS